MVLKAMMGESHYSTVMSLLKNFLRQNYYLCLFELVCCQWLASNLSTNPSEKKTSQETFKNRNTVHSFMGSQFLFHFFSPSSLFFGIVLLFVFDPQGITLDLVIRKQPDWSPSIW